MPSFAIYTYTRTISSDSKVYAATSSTLNFQGRLLNSSGGLVPDGNYNLEFKLYDTGTDGTGTNLWTETRTGGNVVRVVNGYFSVNLGSVTTFPGTINWDQELWLTMNVGGIGSPTWDGEMLAPGSARTKLTAVPYAFKAGSAKELLDTQGSFTGALSFLTLTADRTINLPDASGTVLLNSTGFANGGNTFGSSAVLGTNDLNDLILRTNSNEGLRLDQAGNVSIGTGADGLEKLEVNGGIKLGNSTGTNAGTLRWTGTDFEGYNGSGWVSLTSGGGTTIVGGTSANFVSGLANVAANTTGTAVEMLLFTNTTAVSNTVGVTGFTAPADGSFTTCLVKNNATITAGTLNVRWRVNGASVGSGVCTMNTTNNRQSASVIDPGTVTFNAGDTIGIAFDTAGLTPGGSNDFTVYWSVQYETSGSSNTSFNQGGNAFGTTGTLGTTDGNGLNIITNGNTRLSFSSAGDATFNNQVTFSSSGIFNSGLSVSGGATVSSGGIAVTGNSTINGNLSSLTGLNFTSGDINLNGGDINNITDIVSSSGLTLNSGGAGDVTINSGSGVIQLGADTLQRNSSGTTNILLNDSSDTTLSLQNNDGTAVANLNVEGLVTANGFSGSGSGLSALNASSVSSGTLDDARLSSNVALLDTIQAFSARQDFNAGLVVGNTAYATAGALRWTGADFEGYNGSGWVSLTSGSGGGSGPLTVAVIQAYDSTGGTDLNTGTPTAVPWDSESKKDTGFTHSNVTNNTRVYLDDAGWYKISYSVSGLNQTGNRNTVFCQVRMNGTTYNVPSGSYGYARNTTDSGTTNSSSIYVQTSSANEYYEVLCSQSGSSGAQLAVANGSWTIAEVTAQPSGGSSLTFNQGGNTFGATAVLGTGDTYGLRLVTDGVGRLIFADTGEATFTSDVTFNTNLFANSGLTSIGGTASINDSSNYDTNINTGTSSGIVTIGGGSATFSLDSTAFDVSSSGALSGISTLTASGAISGATSTDTINGLVINTGALSNITGYSQTSGNFSQTGSGTFSTGTGAVTLNSATTVNNSTTNPGVTISQTGNGSGLRITNSAITSGALVDIVHTTSGFTGTGLKMNIASGSGSFASGNFLDFQLNGTSKLKVDNNGALAITTTSTSGLRVSDGGGLSMLNVDSSGKSVSVGSSTTDANAILLVLDSYNSGTDPTGTNGSIYYNSNLGKFRCFEASTWKDCIGTRQVRSFIDSTTNAVTTNNTTNYWDIGTENNNSYPNITPTSTAKSVTGSVVFQVTSATTADRSVVARIERSIGTLANCGSGTAVGQKPSTFTTNNGDIDSSTIIFLDSPNTTSQVFYRICSDSQTSSGASMTVGSIRVTLEEAVNSN